MREFSSPHFAAVVIAKPFLCQSILGHVYLLSHTLFQASCGKLAKASILMPRKVKHVTCPSGFSVAAVKPTSVMVANVDNRASLHISELIGPIRRKSSR